MSNHKACRWLRVVGGTMIATALIVCVLAILQRTHPAATVGLFIAYGIIALMLPIVYGMWNPGTHSLVGGATAISFFAAVMAGVGIFAVGTDPEDFTNFTIATGVFTAAMGGVILFLASKIKQATVQQ